MIFTGLPLIETEPARRRRDPEDGLGNIGAAGANETGNAEDLPCPNVERYVAEHILQRKVFHRKHHVADRHRLLWKHLGDLTSDHHLDDVVARNVRRRMGADIAAVAEHRELIGNLEQLVHLVGYVHNADALGTQVADDLEQMLHFTFG